MICERPNALNLLLDLGRRICLRLDVCVGRYDPVKELGLAVHAPSGAQGSELIF